MKNAFESISLLKRMGVWEQAVLPLAAKLSTLDRYYNIYSFILEHEPERRYGYIPRILRNKDFRELFGSQYDEPALWKIIHTMEKPLPK